MVIRTRLDQVKLYLRALDSEERRLTTLDRTKTTITDLEMELALKAIARQKVELHSELESLEISE